SNGYKILSFQTYKAVCLIPQVYRVSRDYNGITKACDEGFYDMYDNKKGSLSANLCALRLGLEPRTL
uniref:hypothetical protein n=1 Tax=uncultured Phocaeicola sp. TaxID=990718 RepID=UPI002594EE9A